MVQQAGLAGDPEPSMGRVSAAFADWRIGRCSYFAQLWVDRNFALDYLLKSLEKVLDGAARATVRDLRVVLKAAAYDLLLDLAALVHRHDPAVPDPAGFDEHAAQMLDRHRAGLADALAAPLVATAAVLAPHQAGPLRAQFEQWLASSGWRLINAAGPCST
jgi:hypothetical protein